jgi:hypothetical protein
MENLWGLQWALPFWCLPCLHVRHSESQSSRKLESEKLAVCAPFLEWIREKTMCYLFCKCLISEEELTHHLLMHGLRCLLSCVFLMISEGSCSTAGVSTLGVRNCLWIIIREVSSWSWMLTATCQFPILISSPYSQGSSGSRRCTWSSCLGYTPSHWCCMS